MHGKGDELTSKKVIKKWFDLEFQGMSEQRFYPANSEILQIKKKRLRRKSIIGMCNHIISICRAISSKEFVETITVSPLMVNKRMDSTTNNMSVLYPIKPPHMGVI